MPASGSSLPRVAFVTTMAGAPWGGSESLWHGTAMRMRRAGLAVATSVFDWGPADPPQVRELETAGCLVRRRPRDRHLLRRLLDRRHTRVTGLAISADDVRWLRDFAPDLVVVSQGYPLDGLPWMNACRRLGFRYSSVVQAAGELWWPEDDIIESMRDDYLGAASVHFVSRANRSLVERQLGVNLPNAVVTSNPWNLTADTPVPWPGDQDETRLACVGRLDPRAKGQDVLLEVLSHPKWRSRPVSLHLYGEGPCAESVRRLASMLGLDNVRFHGQVGDIRRIWESNHALVLPSRFEGLPLVIVEAMLCGRVVITSDVAGNAEYIEDGVSGFVAAAPVPALLDEAMERAWSLRGEWHRIGELARDRVRRQLPADPYAAFESALLAAAAP